MYKMLTNLNFHALITTQGVSEISVFLYNGNRGYEKINNFH